LQNDITVTMDIVVGEKHCKTKLQTKCSNSLLV